MLLDKIRKKEEQQLNPFFGINYAIEQLVSPQGVAVFTLSELRDREVRALTVLDSFNELFKQQLGTNGRKTVLDVMKESYLLYKISVKRRRVKELVKVLRAARGGAQTPVILRPVKRIFSYGESEE